MLMVVCSVFRCIHFAFLSDSYILSQKMPVIVSDFEICTYLNDCCLYWLIIHCLWINSALLSVWLFVLWWLFVVCSLAVDMYVGICGARADAMDASSVLLGYSGARSAEAADKTSSSVYLSVISQQTYLGCWTLNTELSKLMEVSLDQLQKSAPVKVICITSSCELSKKSNCCLIFTAVPKEMSSSGAYLCSSSEFFDIYTDHCSHWLQANIWTCC